MNLSIIGGASGVGKTSLLKLFSDIQQVNTGDLFKAAMSLDNRDKIRKGDWSLIEPDVTLSIEKVTSESIQAKQDLIIDTHFAAKIFDRNFRIGLREKYLYQLGQFIFGSDLKNELRINIVLIKTNIFMLLARRRLDKSRNRELIPSACYNDLRCNEIYSYRYLAALRRAADPKQSFKIEYHSIDNDRFDLSQKHLANIIRRQV